MIPLTIGFLITGPLAGVLSDRYGARVLATVGLAVSGGSFLLLELLPINFSYIWFAVLILMFAVGMGLFFAPNQAAVMNSLPPDQRGAGAGMLNTFQNSATVLSMGLFFTIVTLGLAARLPPHLYKGLVAAGRRPRPRPTGGQRAADRQPVLRLPRLQPDQGAARPDRGAAAVPPHQVAYITGRSFFPKLIEQPFAGGLHLAFTFAAIATAIAIMASAVRGSTTSTRPSRVAEELAEGAAESARRTGSTRRPRWPPRPRCPTVRIADERQAGHIGCPGGEELTYRAEATEPVNTTARRAPPRRPATAAEQEELLGIGAAAARAGVSERALRYYQQLGLLEPACTTPGGLRRYSEDDLARVARIRELQTLLGLNLDEIAVVLRNEDRLAEIRSGLPGRADQRRGAPAADP